MKDTETGEQQYFRFNSRTVSDLNYVEFKPFDKKTFESKEITVKFGAVASTGRFIKNIGASNISIYKIETDVLGNRFIIKKEGDKPKLTF